MLRRVVVYKFTDVSGVLNASIIVLMETSTERRGLVVNTATSYLGSAGFKSRPGDRISSLIFFRSFPQFLQANAGRVPKIGHGRFLPNPFEFIIHLSPYHSTLYNLIYY
jgi:hypothetical protein